MIGAMYVLLELVAPWVRERRHEAWMNRFAVTGLFAMFLVVLGLLGGTVLFVQLVEAVQSAEAGRIAYSAIAMFIGVPVVAKTAGWLGRAQRGREAEAPVRS